MATTPMLPEETPAEFTPAEAGGETAGTPATQEWVANYVKGFMQALMEKRGGRGGRGPRGGGLLG